MSMHFNIYFLQLLYAPSITINCIQTLQKRNDENTKEGNKTHKNRANSFFDSGKLNLFWVLQGVEDYDLIIMDSMLQHKCSLLWFGACFEAIGALGSLHDSSLFDARHEPFLSSHQSVWWNNLSIANQLFECGFDAFSYCTLETAARVTGIEAGKSTFDGSLDCSGIGSVLRGKIVFKFVHKRCFELCVEDIKFSFRNFNSFASKCISGKKHCGQG